MSVIFRMLVVWLLAAPTVAMAQGDARAPAPLPDAAAAACPPVAQPPTPDQLQAALRAARDRGALWKATRDGRTAYLFGTIHVGQLDWAVPGPRITAALRASDTLALELDITDPALMARMLAPAASPPPALPSALAGRMARSLDAACLPPAARPLFEAMHPVMRAVSLSVLDARWAGLDAGYSQEASLAGFGRAAQMRLVSLETPELQQAALVPADAAQATRMVGDMLAQIENGATRRSARRLAAAWERGDLDELVRYESWCECVVGDDDRQLMKRLLDDRNGGLADGIDALHREGRRVFAGVGVLHMVGPLGLPALLAARGFQVERVALQ